MKTIFFLVLLLPTLSVARAVALADTGANKVIFSEAISTRGSKQELFERALKWFGKTFRSRNDIIRVSTAEEKISGTWTFRPDGGNAEYASVNVSVQIAQGAVKYRISELTYLSSKKRKNINTDPKDVNIEQAVEHLNVSLKTAMTKSDQQ